MLNLFDESRKEEEPPPPRALAISLFALMAACIVAVIRPEQVEPVTQSFWGLAWLLGLIPAFLLSYHRGSQGATVALALGMVFFTAAEIAAPMLLEERIEWTVYAVATGTLLFISLGLGWITESLHVAGGHPLAGRERASRLEALQRAIDRGQFELYYQPIVDLSDDSVAGVEVLVRWNHPRRGVLRPRDFLPFAEATDLDVPLGKWVLGRSLQHLDSWLGRFRGEGFFFNVNVTLRQARSREFRQHVRTLVQRAREDGIRFLLEMTEYTLHDLGSELQDLQDTGAGILIDDFGEGPTALGELRKRGVDGLKLDGVVVRRLTEGEAGAQARAIGRSATEVGRSLGLIVVAESVETREQYDAVRELGCRYGQGYFFADPMPVTGLDSHLEVEA